MSDFEIVHAALNKGWDGRPMDGGGFDALDRIQARVADLELAVKYESDTVGQAVARMVSFQFRIANLEAFLEAEACCPCCEGVRECLDGCTFATDCPAEWERVMLVREVLGGEDGSCTLTFG